MPQEVSILVKKNKSTNCNTMLNLARKPDVLWGLFIVSMSNQLIYYANIIYNTSAVSSCDAVCTALLMILFS